MSDILSFARLHPGDLFPWSGFGDKADPRFAFHTAAGRYQVFCFYRSADTAEAKAALEAVNRYRAQFDDKRACFFGVSLDAEDKTSGRTANALPGLRFFHDTDGRMSRTCGALPLEREGTTGADYFRPYWLILDPMLHVLEREPVSTDPEGNCTVLERLAKRPAPQDYAGFEIPIPVLLLPHVFEPAFCQHLVGLYDQHGGAESGVYRDGAGAHDHSFKRRKDYTVEDPSLIRAIQGKIHARVLPEIERLFFMKITRMERYIVGCYAAEDNAHFAPHRDNGGGLTLHRRFAVSINLTGNFEGGDVSFPEYSTRGIKAPPGWAVVFPANILHAVSRVTAGRRYAFLPFVYDDEGARIRHRELERYHADQVAEDGPRAA